MNPADYFTYNQDTGQLIGRHGRAVGCTRPDGYLQVSCCGKTYLAHRVVWLLAKGQWPEHEIDHIDGDRTNNKLENLRSLTRRQNAQNLHVPRSNSGFIGVHIRKRDGKAVANLGTKHIGLFDTAQEAYTKLLEVKRATYEFNTL